MTRICYLQYCLPYRGILLTRVFIIEQTIKHVSEAHLPKSLCPDGILRVKIPGWCAGAHLQHGLDKPGYMFFLREGVEAGALKSLRINQPDDIVLPFLEENRKAKGWKPGTPIPEDLRGCYRNRISKGHTRQYHGGETGARGRVAPRVI